MREPSTPAGTWAPDWDGLDRVYWNGRRGDHQSSRGALVHVIAEYQRQAAAAGLVMVRRDVLQELVNRYGFFRDNKYYLEARDILAATPESAPGGDGS